MWQCQHSEVTHSSESKIWNIWADVSHWPTWNHALVSATLAGEFQQGSTIELQYVHNRIIKATITRCDIHKGFVMVAKLPLAKLIFSHEIFEQGELHKITQQVICKGPLAFFWQRIFGSTIAKQLPETIKNLVKIADQVTASSPF